MASCNSCSGENPRKPCPARMSDGRIFSDYRPRCLVQGELMDMVSKADMMQSSYEARMYLQHNAERVMEMNRSKALSQAAPCAPCTRPVMDQSIMIPERYVVRCDAVSCSRREVNPYGIGDGRAYK